MRKFLSIFAVALLMVACGAKSTMTIEDKFVNYLEQINEAVKGGDIAQAEVLIAETEKWYGSLSEKEQLEAEKALDKNADKLNDIYESIDQYYDLLDGLAPEE